MRLYNQNIWGNTVCPIGNRNILVKELIEEFCPDICCFQECNPKTSRAGSGSIEEIIAPQYIEIVPEFSDRNFTPIFYRPDNVELIEGGYFPFEGKNDMDSKSSTWGVFREKTSRKIVIFISTHFWWKSDDESDNTQRKNNADAVVNCVKDLLKKYNAAVIVSGDLNSGNTKQGTGGYDRMIELGMSDVRYIAKETDNSFTASYNPPNINELGLYENGEDREFTIDYVFSFNEELLRADKFSVIRSKKALNSSDHSPLIFDFELL